MSSLPPTMPPMAERRVPAARSAAAGGHAPVAARALPRVLARMLALDDFEPEAARILPRPIFGYASGGSETNASLRANRSAFDDYAFIPRVMVDVSVRSQRRTLFGQSYDSPFGFAPMGGTSLAGFDGDRVLARVAASANIPMILSGASLTRLEDVRKVGPTAWFQGYIPGDDAAIRALVERVGNAGYDTLVVTADVPVAANRENNVRNGYSAPLRPTAALAWQGITHPRWLFGTALRTLWRHGMPHTENMGSVRVPLVSRSGVRERGRRDGFSWQHLALIRGIWPGRLVVKGLLSGEDAHVAAESGVDGVIVSNHGGRQLDGAIAPLRALPGVVARAGTMTVMMDSGVRRGTDVLKALALGAQFVFAGRPFLFAHAVAGEAGVAHAVKLLREEIDRDLALLGAESLDQVGRQLLHVAGR
ncbi:MAG: alpha-hydroxy-acid oxidizing protein [Burkholderiales bacterium]|jgi:L-lactate dehydrogenase (cytochrome)|nr:alpha-hydroxy-acid oxidizing protein [Burkholderiales bacterium]